MKKSEKQTIRRIAYEVREWAEDFAPTRGFHSDTLECMCGICSYALWKRLRAAKIRAFVVVNDCHVFVSVKEYLIDISATQFGIQRRVVFRLFRWLPTESYAYWSIHETFGTEAAIRKMFRTWPSKQKPPYRKLN